MRVLYSTAKFRGTASQWPVPHMSDGKVHDIDAWFELQLHEGPPDPDTWEGGGKTIGEWREEFKRLRDPRVSFVWTACDVAITSAEAARGSSS